VYGGSDNKIVLFELFYLATNRRVYISCAEGRINWDLENIRNLRV